MGASHRPLGASWWLGCVLAANAAGAGINPMVAAAGAVVAPAFAAGRLSPDADVSWLRRLGHRQATHRPRTALALTAVTTAIWGLGWLLLADDAALAGSAVAAAWSWGVHWVAWAPAAGWWSHLGGDVVFGRIPLGRRTGDLLAVVLPGSLERRLLRRGGRSGRQAWWFGVGLDTDGLVERGQMYVDKLPRGLRWLARGKGGRTASGLHTTVRVLPFAPTTVLMVVATWAAMGAVVWQWAGWAT